MRASHRLHGWLVWTPPVHFLLRLKASGVACVAMAGSNRPKRWLNSSSPGNRLTVGALVFRCGRWDSNPHTLSDTRT